MFPGSDDTYWMQKAINLARYAEQQGEVPVGAVVVYNNELIGQGWNSPIANHDPSAHAEIMAIRNAAFNLGNYRLVDSTLYVTLEPCLMCAGAILHARIKRLIFAATDPKTGAVVSVNNCLEPSNSNHSISYESGLLAEESSQLLKIFFQARR